MPFPPAAERTPHPARIQNLKDGRWVANAENLVLAGQSGTGKTHLAIALGQKALELGYKAMQFNAVVSINVASIRLWKQLGFAIVGTIPNGFHMRKKA